MAIKFCNKESECKCNDYNEYEMKLSCMKTKLHSRYIGCIAFGIVVWTLATGEANNAEFSSWISFASTITSIILSVIAIFMSISGENKTNTMRDKMEEASQRIEKTAKDIEASNRESAKNIDELRKEMDDLKLILENIPDKTAKKMEELSGVQNVEIKTQNSGKGWL